MTADKREQRLAHNVQVTILPVVGCFLALEFSDGRLESRLLMPLHPEAQQMIKEVESLSGRMVHVMEEPELKVMATITTARGSAPAHFLRYRPGTRAVDYLVAYQLGFLVRLFSCPAEERFEVMASPVEQEEGIKALGLGGLPTDFARSMIDHIVVQLRTYSVGFRVDQWIRSHCPGLRDQQEHAIRAQLAENAQALAPEIREMFPKGLVDANTAMNAAFATVWGEILGDPRHSIAFKALGYGGKAKELLEVLEVTPDDPRSDRSVIGGWAKALGLGGSFHFQTHQFS